MQTLDAAQLDLELNAADLPTLRHAWSKTFGRPAPKGSCRDVLLRGIYWQRQAVTEGGLSAETRQSLSRLAQALVRNPDFRVGPVFKPGTVLVREWHGHRHDVHVLERGFEYGGKIHQSLSSVARTITGTRWNGPRFFGLKTPPQVRE